MKKTIEERLEQLQELITLQYKALKTANELIDLKEKQLELSEQVKEIQSKQLKTLIIVLFVFVVVNLTCLLIELYNAS
jgi:hypothetical protein